MESQPKHSSLPPVHGRCLVDLKSTMIQLPPVTHLQNEGIHMRNTSLHNETKLIGPKGSTHKSPQRTTVSSLQPVSQPLKFPTGLKQRKLPTHFDYYRQLNSLMKPYNDIQFEKVINIMKSKNYITNCDRCNKPFDYNNGQIINQPTDISSPPMTAEVSGVKVSKPRGPFRIDQRKGRTTVNSSPSGLGHSIDYDTSTAPPSVLAPLKRDFQSPIHEDYASLQSGAHNTDDTNGSKEKRSPSPPTARKKRTVDLSADIYGARSRKQTLYDQWSPVKRKETLGDSNSPIKRKETVTEQYLNSKRKENTIERDPVVTQQVKEKQAIIHVKNQILNNLSKYILSAAGLQVRPEADVTYKYYIGKGNNSRLIRNLLAQRPWWVPAKGLADANFVWTQGRIRDYLHGMQKCTPTQQQLIADKVKIMTGVRIPKGGMLNVKGQKIDFKTLNWETILDSKSFTQVQPSAAITPSELQVHGKLEKNFHLANKKALFCNMTKYYWARKKDPFNYIPLTFHIRNGVEDAEFQRFKLRYAEEKAQGKSIWIIKPGEYTNQGRGIVVCSMVEQIMDIVRQNRCPRTGLRRTHIIQKYIEKPLLIHKRKFDIRLYSLMTCYNGIVQGYFYTDGYLRTSCKEFKSSNISNRYIHLTNDAIQKHSDDYGKFEQGNKMSYADFQRYIDHNIKSKKQANFMYHVLPKIKKMVKDTMKATYLKIDVNRRQHTFELFGYDFMIDANMKPWLIECNTNPCLALSSPYLQRLIPEMLENMFRIAIDPIFPEPEGFQRKKPLNVHQIMEQCLPENTFELIFHELVDGPKLYNRLAGDMSPLTEEDPCLIELSDEEADEEQTSDEEEPETK